MIKIIMIMIMILLKNSLEIEIDGNKKKHSKSYEDFKKSNNAFDKYILDYNRLITRNIVHIFYIFCSIKKLTFVKHNNIK